MIRWWRAWRERRNSEAANAREQEAKLHHAERQTAVYERLAQHVADLPDEELAARMRRAMTLAVRQP